MYLTSTPFTGQNREPRNRRRELGFSLIEVLVAMIVLSLGLLGLAALQVNSLKFNQVAHLRSQASTLAYQMLDSMRASPTAAKAGDFNILTMASTVPAAGTSAASNQLKLWMDQVNTLPNGQGRVCLSATPDPATAVCAPNGDFAVITVQWNEADDTGARSARQFQLVSQVAP